MKMATQSLLNSMAINYLYCANIKDMSKVIDLSGKTFGDFKVISYRSRDKYNNALWLCACIKCSNEKVLIGSRLSNNRQIKCYCGVHYNYKHGDSNKTKEYRAWRHMLNRCYNNTVLEYPDYGARGIKVCDRWINSYHDFLLDIGRAPSNDHSLDRKDVNGNYEPGNVRWATLKEQANNKRRTYMVEYKGEKIPLGILCEKFSVPIELIRGRLNLGWPVDLALTTKNLRTNSPIKIDTETKTNENP